LPWRFLPVLVLYEGHLTLLALLALGDCSYLAVGVPPQQAGWRG